jgi:hypothetical protein
MQKSQEEDAVLVAHLQQGLIRSLQNAGIRQTSVLSAFRRVPRHAFIKEWYERGPAPSKNQRGVEKLSSASFHPANLFNKDFAFFLQCHLPSAMAYRMTKGQEQFTYLYDPQTERVIRFDFDTEVVRGSVELWRQLCSIALAFQRLGQPPRSAYIFEMKEDGQQLFRLGEHSWRIV